jgi:hypothetical protein
MIYEIIVSYATETTNQSYKYIEWSENENG